MTKKQAGAFGATLGGALAPNAGMGALVGSYQSGDTAQERLERGALSASFSGLGHLLSQIPAYTLAEETKSSLPLYSGKTKVLGRLGGALGALAGHTAANMGINRKRTQRALEDETYAENRARLEKLLAAGAPKVASDDRTIDDEIEIMSSGTHGRILGTAAGGLLGSRYADQLAPYAQPISSYLTQKLQKNIFPQQVAALGATALGTILGAVGGQYIGQRAVKPRIEARKADKQVRKQLRELEKAQQAQQVPAVNKTGAAMHDWKEKLAGLKQADAPFMNADYFPPGMPLPKPGKALQRLPPAPAPSAGLKALLQRKYLIPALLGTAAVGGLGYGLMRNADDDADTAPLPMPKAASQEKVAGLPRALKNFQQANWTGREGDYFDAAKGFLRGNMSPDVPTPNGLTDQALRMVNQAGGQNYSRRVAKQMAGSGLTPNTRATIDDFNQLKNTRPSRMALRPEVPLAERLQSYKESPEIYGEYLKQLREDSMPKIGSENLRKLAMNFGNVRNALLAHGGAGAAIGGVGGALGGGEDNRMSGALSGAALGAAGGVGLKKGLNAVRRSQGGELVQGMRNMGQRFRAAGVNPLEDVVYQNTRGVVNNALGTLRGRMQGWL